MERNASLRLILLTDDGKPLGGQVEIRLTNAATGFSNVGQHDASVPIVLNLGVLPAGVYTVEVVPPAPFQAASQVCKIAPGVSSELRFIIHRGKTDDNGCPHKIDDQVNPAVLTTQLATRLAGTPADGSASQSQAPAKVIWVDGGDEVLVHLDSINTVILDGHVLISIDLESDQTGRATMVVSFAVGGANDPAGLVAITDEFPRGNGLLASRWGSAVQAAAWSSLLSLANDHATERFAAPLGIAAVNGTLTLTAGPALKVMTGVLR
jgi:hypothetical protein